MKTFFQTYRNRMGALFLLLVLAAGALWIHQEGVKDRMQQDIAHKILRFHIRANSDSTDDQSLKLKIRDAVGAYMENKLVGVDGLAECSDVVENNLAAIVQIAEQVVLQEGYAYPVTAKVETVEFPEKTYGEYVFPAGDYLALNVVVGSGKGQNWWCVMYPNMCFHGAVYEVVTQDAKESLKRVLSEDEYDAVLKSGQYKIRFKYLDFLNSFFK